MQALEEVRMAVDAEKARFTKSRWTNLISPPSTPALLPRKKTMKRYYADITEDDHR